MFSPIREDICDVLVFSETWEPISDYEKAFSELVSEIIGSDGRRIQTFLLHGYIIEKAQEAPANVAAVACNFTADLKRLYQ